MAAASLSSAARPGQDLTQCYVLAEAVCPIALMAGDVAHAEWAVTELMQTAPRFNFVFWTNIGRCLEGAVMIERGEFRMGAHLLDRALTLLAKTGRSTHGSAAAVYLARALAAMGRTAEASACVDRALLQTARSGERWCRPQLLRLKGELDPENAVRFSARSNALASRQGAVLWQSAEV